MVCGFGDAEANTKLVSPFFPQIWVADLVACDGGTVNNRVCVSCAPLKDNDALKLLKSPFTSTADRRSAHHVDMLDYYDILARCALKARKQFVGPV